MGAVRWARAVGDRNVPKRVEEWAATGTDAWSERRARLLAVVRLAPSSGRGSSRTSGRHSGRDQGRVSHSLRKCNRVRGTRMGSISLLAAVVGSTSTSTSIGDGSANCSVSGTTSALVVRVANVRCPMDRVVVRRVSVRAAHSRHWCGWGWLATGRWFGEGGTTWLTTTNAHWFTSQYWLVSTATATAVQLRTPGMRGVLLLIFRRVANGQARVTVHVLSDDRRNGKRRPGSIIRLSVVSFTVRTAMFL